jgi:AcrR family transcriptional regulator
MAGEEIPKASLRERKKARTRDAIQRQAIRLVIEQGYDETTVAQIAEAAEVAESTLFRYFPTKESIFLYDEQDAVFFDALRAVSKEAGVVEALQRAMGAVVEMLTPEVREKHMGRARLIATVPQLRSAWVADTVGVIGELSRVVGERVDRSPDDVGVRAFAGAAIGIGLSLFLMAMERDRTDFELLFEEGYRYLEGFDF